MQAEHDEQAPERADDKAGDGGLEVDEHQDDLGNDVGEDRHDRTDHKQAKDAANEERQDVGEERAHKRGQRVRKGLVHLGGNPDGKDRRQNRR